MLVYSTCPQNVPITINPCVIAKLWLQNNSENPTMLYGEPVDFEYMTFNDIEEQLESGSGEHDEFFMNTMKAIHRYKTPQVHMPGLWLKSFENIYKMEQVKGAWKLEHFNKLECNNSEGCSIATMPTASIITWANNALFVSLFGFIHKLKEMGISRRNHASIYLKDNIFCCGGWASGGAVETYNEKGGWTFVNSMKKERSSFGLVNTDYTMYAFGGQGTKHEYLESMERYDTREGTWATPYPIDRSVAKALVLPQQQNVIYCFNDTYDGFIYDLRIHKITSDIKPAMSYCITQ